MSFNADIALDELRKVSGFPNDLLEKLNATVKAHFAEKAAAPAAEEAAPVEESAAS